MVLKSIPTRKPVTLSFRVRLMPFAVSTSSSSVFVCRRAEFLSDFGAVNVSVLEWAFPMVSLATKLRLRRGLDVADESRRLMVVFHNPKVDKEDKR